MLFMLLKNELLAQQHPLILLIKFLKFFVYKLLILLHGQSKFEAKLLLECQVAFASDVKENKIIKISPLLGFEPLTSEW